MTSRFRWTTLVPVPLLLALLGCPQEPADDDDATAPGAEWEALPASIASVFEDEAADLGASGAAVAIWLDGVLYAGTYGTRDPDGGDAIAPTTLFRIGSTTKMMTSTAALAAVDRGALAMDDAVVEHLPGLDIAGDAPFSDVTLHHLLSHTSGISEITPLDAGGSDDLLQDFTFSSFGFAGQTWMMAPAGSFWNYSNPNFALAGAVVEAVDGRIYRDIMQEDVFGPLGMDRTLFLGQDVAEDGDFAWSDTYDWTGQTTDTIRVGAESYDHGWSRPAGFAWSSVLDMVRFGRFLLDGDEALLSTASHQALVGEHANMYAYGDYGSYGYGVMHWSQWFAGNGFYDVATTEHNGAIPGYAADLITVPGRDFVMVTLAAGDGAYFGALRQAVWEDLLGAEEIDAPEPGIDPTTFADYVGTYEDPYNVGTIQVTQNADGDLEWELPLLDQVNVAYGTDLLPTSRGSFRVSIQNRPTSISFIAADGTQEGPARWLRHRAFVGDRQGVVTRDAAPDPARLREALRRSAL